MRGLTLAVFALLPFLAGCDLPIELDVDKDGRILIPRQEGFFILDPATGKVTLAAPTRDDFPPLFARFTPDGRSMLAMEDSQGAAPALISLADGKMLFILRNGDPRYYRISPDGKSVASCHGGPEDQAPMGKRTFQLLVVALQAKAEARPLAMSTALEVRWLPDSKRLLTVVFKKKVDESVYAGQLVAIEAATGKSEILAEALVTDDPSFDVSPDGRKVLLSAFAAREPKEGPALVKAPEMNLFLVDLPERKTTALRYQAAFAKWSPDGTRILIYGPGAQGPRLLSVVEPKPGKEKPPGLCWTFATTSNAEQVTKISPGWVDKDTIFYFSRRSVYGRDGLGLELMVQRVDGGEPRSLQLQIDNGVAKAIEEYNAGQKAKEAKKDK